MDKELILSDGINIARLEETARMTILSFSGSGKNRKKKLISKLKDSAKEFRLLMKKYPHSLEPERPYNRIARLTLEKLGHEVYDPIFVNN